MLKYQGYQTDGTYLKHPVEGMPNFWRVLTINNDPKTIFRSEQEADAYIAQITQTQKEEPKIQITITEHNQHEGDTFHYVFNNRSENDISLLENLLANEIEEGVCEVKKTNLRPSDINLINEFSGNTYANSIDFYEFKSPIEGIDTVDFYETSIYKGIGLKKVHND